MRRVMAIIYCSLAMLMPWRVRVWFGSVLAYSSQAVYGFTTWLVRTIVKNLQPKKESA
ncbi:MAG: hypothetical protein IT350_14655 [Deltaproteobacteria bacterium]|nr:hypothetical protein [Deltaproteobacteria bacterium]